MTFLEFMSIEKFQRDVLGLITFDISSPNLCNTSSIILIKNSGIFYNRFQSARSLNMYYNGNQFYAGDGIVKKGVENTIKSVSRLAHEGMKETDKEIIRIMLDNE